MKKDQRNLVSKTPMFLNVLVSISKDKKRNIFNYATLLILVVSVFFACSKKEDPIIPPTPLTKTVANTISVIQTPQTTIEGDKGGTISIARYKGTSLKGTSTTTFEKKDQNNEVYEVQEHQTYPQDSLEITFKEKGAGVIIQQIVSPELSNQKEDINNDGVLDTVSYTAQTKTSESQVLVELPEETAPNTITVTETPPLTLEGTIGDALIISKFAGAAEQGELVYSFAIEGASDVVEITEEDDKLRVKFLTEGTLIIKQQLNSLDETVMIDDNNDGIMDRILNLTAEMMETETAVESTAKSIEQARAEVQAYLDDLDVVWDPENPIEINIPLDEISSSTLSFPNIEPMGAAGSNAMEYGPNLEYMTFPWGVYPYIGGTSKLRLTFADGETVEFTLPDVKMDASTPEKREKTLNFLVDYAVHALLKSINNAPDSMRRFYSRDKDLKIFVEGSPDSEVYQTFLAQQASRNQILASSGVPYRESIIENEGDLGPIGYNIDLDEPYEGSKLVFMTRSEFASNYPELEDGLSVNAQGASFLGAGITWVDKSQSIRRQKGITLEEVNQVYGMLNDVEQNSVDSQGNNLFLPTDSRSSGTDIITIQIPTEFIFRFMYHNNFTSLSNALDMYNDQASLIDAGNDVLDQLIIEGKIKG